MKKGKLVVAGAILAATALTSCNGDAVESGVKRERDRAETSQEIADECEVAGCPQHKRNFHRSHAMGVYEVTMDSLANEKRIAKFEKDGKYDYSSLPYDENDAEQAKKRAKDAVSSFHEKP